MSPTATKSNPQAVPVEEEAPQLTPQQQLILTKLERKIEQAQRSFISIADALRQVRDEKLYLAGYKTFRAYMGQRWEFDYATQSRMEDAIEVLTVLRKHGVEEKELPGNEGQARQLARVLKASGEEDRGERISASLIVEVAGLTKSGTSSAEQATTPPERFKGKAHFATVMIGNEDDAKVIAEKFAPNAETKSQKGGYAVSVGIDSAEELAFVLHLFDESKSSEMTIRIVR
jgi:hypothetical protein